MRYQPLHPEIRRVVLYLESGTASSPSKSSINDRSHFGSLEGSTDYVQARELMVTAVSSQHRAVVAWNTLAPDYKNAVSDVSRKTCFFTSPHSV